MAIVQTSTEPKYQRTASGWTARGIVGGSEVLGLSVVDSRGERIGVLHDLMLDMRTGRIAYGVVILDHAPEWSERVIAVPWNAMSLGPDVEHFRINALRDWIERAPSMQPDAMPNLLDHECAVLIHSFFGTRPYWEAGGQQHS